VGLVGFQRVIKVHVLMGCRAREYSALSSASLERERNAILAYIHVQVQITTRPALHMHRFVGRPAVVMGSLIMSFHANSDDPLGRFTLFTLGTHYFYGSVSWHPS